jgi:hypothetical protein
VQLLFRGGPWANQLLDSSVHSAPEFVAPSLEHPGVYRRTNEETLAGYVVYEWSPGGTEQSGDAHVVAGIVRHEASTEGLTARVWRGGDRGRVRVRFALEVVVAVIALALAVVTVVWRGWIEDVFRVNPDQGDGAVEWAFVFSLTAISVSLMFAAKRECRRLGASHAP